MKSEPDKATLDAWLDDPKNYKLGFFYFNPKDRRILPAARRPSFRIGFSGKTLIGWTINLGNPFSVLTFIFIISFIVSLILLLTKYVGD